MGWAWRALVVTLLLVPSPARAVAERSYSLQRGDVGPQVAAWQHMLNAWMGGQHPLIEDGVFGPATERATRRFERSPGVRLPVDGVVTEAERLRWLGGFLTGSGAEKPDLYLGVRDARVGHLQVALNTWVERSGAGLVPLWIDVLFGPRTEAAVRAFQSSEGLVADGIVGPKTWARLGRAGLLRFPPGGGR